MRNIVEEGNLPGRYFHSIIYGERVETDKKVELIFDFRNGEASRRQQGIPKVLLSSSLRLYSIVFTQRLKMTRSGKLGLGTMHLHQRIDGIYRIVSSLRNY